MKKIALRGINGAGKFALVDDEDYKKVSQHKWYLHVDGYAASNIKGRPVMLHHFVFGKPVVGFETDHKNRNRLDNRRRNLRFATRNQNNRNKETSAASGLRGVYFDRGQPRNKVWKASIRVNKRMIHLGYFDTAEEAAHAYDRALWSVDRRFGQFNTPGVKHLVPIQRVRAQLLELAA